MKNYLFVKRFYLTACLLTLTLLLGCTTIPTQEMSDARQALQAARNSGAGTQAPEPLGQAEVLLDEATTALTAGHYGQARHKAIAAKEAAIAARDKAIESAQ